MSSPKSSSSSSFSLLSSRFRGLWHVTWTRLTGRRHPGLHLGPWHADPALDWLRLKFESKDMNATGKHWTGNPLDVKKTIAARQEGWKDEAGRRCGSLGAWHLTWSVLTERSPQTQTPPTFPPVPDSSLRLTPSYHPNTRSLFAKKKRKRKPPTALKEGRWRYKMITKYLMNIWMHHQNH